MATKLDVKKIGIGAAFAYFLWPVVKTWLPSKATPTPMGSMQAGNPTYAANRAAGTPSQKRTDGFWGGHA